MAMGELVKLQFDWSVELHMMGMFKLQMIEVFKLQSRTLNSVMVELELDCLSK